MITQHYQLQHLEIKVVEQITPETPVATIKKAESKPKIKKKLKYNYTRADNNKRTTTEINKS